MKSYDYGCTCINDSNYLSFETKQGKEAETAAGSCGPVLQVAEWVEAPIIRKFNNNITSMKNEAGKLQIMAGGVQSRVDIARNDVRVISGAVESWLKNCNDIKDEMDEILNEAPNVKSGCLKFSALYSLSKRAKKTTDSIKELQGSCNFKDDDISQPLPPAAREAITLGITYDFESRKRIEDEIMETLRLGDVRMMGICGIGGVGKTIMAKRIMNRALAEHVVEEIVMVKVSKIVDESRIQFEMGGTLGLKLRGETMDIRVQKLRYRLRGTKRALIVLDDVWEALQLEDMGIPSDHKGFTILLTSQNRDVYREMGIPKVLGVEMLSKEESWFLFRQTVGACADDKELTSIAKEVVNECHGLPIALKAAGVYLIDEMDVRIWKDALQQLRSDPNIFVKHKRI